MINRRYYLARKQRTKPVFKKEVKDDNTSVDDSAVVDTPVIPEDTDNTPEVPEVPVVTDDTDDTPGVPSEDTTEDKPSETEQPKARRGRARKEAVEEVSTENVGDE